MNLALVGCSQLVTLAGPPRPRAGTEMRDLGIVEDGALLIWDGQIVKTGTRAEIEPLIDSQTTVVEAGGRAVLPGFVDAHTHPVFAGNRTGEFDLRAEGATYRQISDAGGGIRSTVQLTRAAAEDNLLEAASRYSRWFLRNGTTLIEAKSGYGLSLESELKLLRVIARLNASSPIEYVPTFLGAHQIPDEYIGRPEEYVSLVCEEMLPLVAREKLARYCDVFCEPGMFSVAQSRRILSRAQSLNLGLRLHADQLSRSGGAELAAELGAATADHLEYLDAAGIAALRAAHVQPVLLPGSVYALGSHRFPDARAMIDAGLAVVLATDFNPGTSPVTSMPMILSLAITNMRMSAAEAIVAATINAACSLGRGGVTGSLEPGKRADFVIHDCADYREIGYFFGVEHPDAVYVNGRLVHSKMSCSA
ncbi:MAG: imidazolonepropionase [Acidobacteriota bacterium]|nr:imidazolonepropionase [Acidobacteriota bacterium]